MADTKTSALANATPVAGDLMYLSQTAAGPTDKSVLVSALKAFFSDTPTLVTPTLGVATATSINKVALTAPATAATLTIANNQTLTVNGSATITNGTHSGTNTGDQTSVTGNAGTATALATARALNGVNFDGTAAITVPPFYEINTQTADYTAVIGDRGKLIRMNKATAVTLTIPPNSSVAYTVGDVIVVQQMGVGATTIAPGSGVTLNRAAQTTLVLAGQLATVALVKTATDTWDVLGKLTSTTPIVVSIIVDAPDTALTVADGKAIFRVPSTLTGKKLTGVAAHVCTVSSSGAPAIQVRSITGGYDMLSTGLTIDASEKDSSTAATAAVIDTASSHDVVTTADEIAIDCDTAGTGTKGLIVELQFT